MAIKIVTQKTKKYSPNRQNENYSNKENNMQDYFARCKQYGLLTKAQEREISKEIREKRRSYLLSLLRIPYTWKKLLQQIPKTIKIPKSKKGPYFNYENWRKQYEANKQTIEKILKRNQEDFKVYLRVKGDRDKREIISRIKRRIESGARLAYELKIDVNSFHYIEKSLDRRIYDESHPREKAPYLFGFDLNGHDGSRSRIINSLIREYSKEINKTRREYYDAVGRLVTPNLRLAIKAAGYFKNKKSIKDVELEDLIQEANMGLMMAAERFNGEMGYRFSSYALFWVKQTILRFVNQNRTSLTMRVPLHIKNRLNKLTREVSEKNPETRKKAEENEPLLKIIRYRSLDSPTNTTGKSLLDYLKDDKTNPPDEEADKIFKLQIIGNLLNNLKGRERKIIEMRYGLDNYHEGQTLARIGKKFGIGRERVRQIQEEALEKLRKIARQRFKNNPDEELSVTKK